jgi:hypothetical protein
MLAGRTLVAKEVSSAEVNDKKAETPDIVFSLEAEPGTTGIINVLYKKRKTNICSTE